MDKLGLPNPPTHLPEVYPAQNDEEERSIMIRCGMKFLSRVYLLGWIVYQEIPAVEEKHCV